MWQSVTECDSESSVSECDLSDWMWQSVTDCDKVWLNVTKYDTVTLCHTLSHSVTLRHTLSHHTLSHFVTFSHTQSHSSHTHSVSGVYGLKWKMMLVAVVCTHLFASSESFAVLSNVWENDEFWAKNDVFWDFLLPTSKNYSTSNTQVHLIIWLSNKPKTW